MQSPAGRWLAAVSAVALWSTNAYAADLALAQMGLSWLLLVQFCTAAAALLAVRALLRRRRPAAAGCAGEPCVDDRATGVGRLDRGAILIGVVGLTGTMVLQYVAFATAPIVAANVLSYAWPLLAAVWLAATRRSRHAMVSAALSVLGFVGIALIFASPGRSAGGAADDGAASWGYLAALGSAACMAIYTLGASRRPATEATTLLIPATIIGTAAVAVLTLVSNAPGPTGSGVLAAVYLGLGPMAAGYALWSRAMSGGGAERLSPLGYATPLLSTLLLLGTGAPATSTALLGIGLVLICSVGVVAHARFGRSPARSVAQRGTARPTPEYPGECEVERA